MEIVTKDGRTITLRSVGKRYVEQVMNKFTIPDPPTYTIETVAGDVETHQHNVIYDESGKVLKSSMSTPEEWAAWHKYEADKKAAINARYEAASNFLIAECVPNPPPVSEWSMDFEKWDLTPPDPKDKDYKIFWVQNELVPDEDDQATLMSALYVIGGIVARDKVKEFESFFRLTLARLASSRARGSAAGRSEDARA